MQIGGKTKVQRPTKPRQVIQRGIDINEFAKLSADDEGKLTLVWVGDPNSATKFDSRYAAKFRTRDMENVVGCCYKELV